VCVSERRDGVNRKFLRLYILLSCLFQIIEKFFDTRAAAPPYKPNALSGFGRMLNVPYNVLKDFVQIMKLELVGELCGDVFLL
jgi:hypothetical protein